MKLLKTRDLLRFFLTGVAILGASLGLADQSAFWKKGPYGGTSALPGGALILTPEATNWASAEAASTASYPIWNTDGATVHVHLTLGPAAGPGYGVYVGFMPESGDGPIQSSPNVVGLSINRSATKSGLVVSLSRKEATSPDPSIRGDQYGNFAVYGAWPGAETPLDGSEVDVTLKVNSESVSAEVGGGWSESYPIGLTGKLWPGARLVVRCKNSNDGRGSVTVNRISVDCPQELSRFVQPIDLRSVVNMAFRDEVKDDGKGGWTDQGENDLRNLAVGFQTISSIPFDIIDPASNGGKSCLLLYSKNRTFFPHRSEPVTVDALANSLIFLHSAAWAHSAELAAKYLVTYSDGSQTEIPITIGTQVNDWWGMEPVRAPNAGVLLRVRNDSSLRGEVGIYGYRWINPSPEKSIHSLTFESADGDPVVGILAVSLVKLEVGAIQEQTLRAAFAPEPVVDFRRFPPDRDKISDQVSYEGPKSAPYAFSVAGSYSGGNGGKAMLDLPEYGPEIAKMGGIVRFPYGLEVSFYFWPYAATDWYPVLGAKGGEYGTIERWYYKYGGPQDTLSYQTMLAAYKAKGLKLDLMLNCHSMFDGHDFVYVKTLPEDKMKTQNPLEEGTFSRENLQKIVRNNSTLVDYVIHRGYTNTVSYWEMDNERWDMPGAEYAELVAANVKMLKSKLPHAKVIVCLGELGAYAPEPERTYAIAWSRGMLKRLQELGMAGKIDYFAPHIYPFLADSADEITQNLLADWSVRNIHRSLDYMSSMLDRFGFSNSKFFVSEWGSQSDPLGDQNHNELITSMAAAIGTVKDMMAIYAHPRVEGSTWHQFFADSFVSREGKLPLSQWGEQTVYRVPGKGFISTPPAKAMEMFTRFGQLGNLAPTTFSVPKGVHLLCSKGPTGVFYFAVNSTSSEVKLPLSGVISRSSLFAPTVLATSIQRYGSYGDAPGDIKEILPQEFKDSTLPPYSINLIRSR